MSDELGAGQHEASMFDRLSRAESLVEFVALLRPQPRRVRFELATLGLELENGFEESSFFTSRNDLAELFKMHAISVFLFERNRSVFCYEDMSDSILPLAFNAEINTIKRMSLLMNTVYFDAVFQCGLFKDDSLGDLWRDLVFVSTELNDLIFSYLWEKVVESDDWCWDLDGHSMGEYASLFNDVKRGLSHVDHMAFMWDVGRVRDQYEARFAQIDRLMKSYFYSIRDRYVVDAVEGAVSDREMLVDLEWVGFGVLTGVWSLYEDEFEMYRDLAIEHEIEQGLRALGGDLTQFGLIHSS